MLALWPTTAAFFVPARRIMLALQPNEAGLQSDPEPRRPPETSRRQQGGPFCAGARAVLVGGSPLPDAGQQLPPHLGQHVADFVE